MVAQGLAQAVEGHAALQVVDVVHAHVGAEPAQEGRQDVVRTAVERGIVELPVGRAVPGRFLELVLHVEEPDADRRRPEGAGQPDQEDRRPAPHGPEPGEDHGEREVRAHGADPEPRALAFEPQGQPVLNEEHPGRPEAEENERMAVKAVL